MQLHISDRITLNRARVLIAQHPVVALLWLSSVTLLVVATIVETAHAESWALFVAVVAAVSTCTAVARWVVTRMTGVIALWAEDVQLDDDEPPDCGTVDLARRRIVRQHRTSS